MEHVVLTLTILRLLTVALGLIFLGYAARAYRRTRSRNLLVLTMAILLLTAAVIVEGAVFQLTRDLDTAHLVEAVLTLVAFIVLVGSVLLGDRRRRRLRQDAGARTPDDAPSEAPKDAAPGEGDASDERTSPPP